MAEFTVKEKIESCLALADLAYKSWNDRRQYEWKFVLGIWTVLVIGVGFFSKDVQINTSPFFFCVLLLLAVAGYGFCIVWLRGLWSANQFDREMQFHFQGQARKLLLKSDHSLEEFPYSDKKDLDLPWKKFLLHYSQLTYLVITGILLVVTFMFATGRFASLDEDRLKLMEEATRTSAQSIQTCVRQIEQLTHEVRSAQTMPKSQPRKGNRQ